METGFARHASLEQRAAEAQARRKEFEAHLTEPRRQHYDTKGFVISHRQTSSGFDKYAQVTTAGWVDLYAHYAAEDDAKFDIKNHLALSPNEFETLVANYCVYHPEMMGTIIDRVNAMCEEQEVLRDAMDCPVCQAVIIAGETCSVCGQCYTNAAGEKIPGYVEARNRYRKAQHDDTLCQECNRILEKDEDGVCLSCSAKIVTTAAIHAVVDAL